MRAYKPLWSVQEVEQTFVAASNSGIMTVHAVQFVLLLLLLDIGVAHHPARRMGDGETGQSVQASRLPLYMMQLYRTKDEPGLHHSDSVVSLVAKSCQQIGKKWSITFDLSSMATGEDIQLAELRVRLPGFSDSSSVSVNIYHSSGDRCSDKRCPQSQLLLLGSLEARPASMVSPSSWKVFNVTEMLLHFLRSEEAGKGSKEKETLKGIRRRTANRVTMVVFSRRNFSSRQMPTLIQTAGHSKYVNQSSERVKPTSRSRRRRRRHWRKTGLDVNAEEERRDLLCRRVDMWVDFQKLYWSEWVVYPIQYNAYRCDGRCPTPLDETFNPTNHAYIQSLLNLHYDKVPCVSCVPTRLSPISMLYFQNGKIVMRNHENMVVEECGCR